MDRLIPTCNFDGGRGQEGFCRNHLLRSEVGHPHSHNLGGVFDAGYRGEYNTHLVNLSDKSYTFEEGDKVSQLVIVPVAIVELEETDALGESARGEGKFGSTGRK